MTDACPPKTRPFAAIVGCAACVVAGLAPAAPCAAEGLDEVVVTATRIPEPADRVPAAISVVAGEELRARGATDMASALSLVSGVEAPAGGDAGPSSAVPSFWGLHEFDAFLLVVDGVQMSDIDYLRQIPASDVHAIRILNAEAAEPLYGLRAAGGAIVVETKRGT